MSDTLGALPGLAHLPLAARLRGKLADWRTIRARRGYGGLRDAWYDALWQRTARDLGAQAVRLPGGLTEIRQGRTRLWLRRSELPADSHPVSLAMGDKALVWRLLAEAGEPVPEVLTLGPGDPRAALEMLERHRRGLVVKPAAGTGGGRGVTCGITRPEDLVRAIRRAGGFGGQVLVEPMLQGVVLRLLYLDGRLLDAIRRDPPAITGDGRRSIGALMSAESRARLTAAPARALSPLVADDDCRLFLESRGLRLSDLPDAGERLVVKRAVNQNAAAENHRVKVNPAIEARGAALCRRLGLRVAGLDVIAPDPFSDRGAMICEINVNPGLHHHYLTAAPEDAPPVARLILKRLLAERAG